MINASGSLAHPKSIMRSLKSAPNPASFAFCGFLALASLTPGAARAASEYDASTGVLRIIGTGEGLTSLTTPAFGPPVLGSDPNWRVIAISNNIFPASVAAPAPFYIPTITPSVWYPGSNTTNVPVSGIGDGKTYRWGTYAVYPNAQGYPGSSGTATAGTANAYFSTSSADPNPTSPQPNPYTYIVSTSLTVVKPAYYRFNFNVASDNRVQIFLNGNVDFTSEFSPTITGGTLLGATTVGPANLVAGSSDVLLTVGTHNLNYVVQDLYSNSTFGQTGLLVGTTNFTEVPAPLPLLGAAAAFLQARQLRRRIKHREA
ncbi:MAG: hypothetical protein ACKOXO_07860 [Cyanobium sp.]